ncbi:MAG: TatD family hydrolase [Gammaproteobacteria bacterium]|nr:TatD family hydrolase [Gammaproteobacteria bacterium]
MFIDSHCHLDCIDLKDFDQDFHQLMGTIKQYQVERMLCVSINLDKYPHMRALAEAYAEVDFSVGVHPSDARDNPAVEQQLSELAKDQRVVALGETGLDYFYAKDSKQQQQDSFRLHMRVAQELKKPVIVHTRDAQQDTLDILTQEKVSETGGVLHCFTESWEMAKKALDMGMYISFSGIVTFRNAEALRDVARQVPDDRLLIETDAPYLAPVPHRGKQNHPGWVKHVAECLADVRKTSVDLVAERSKANYHRLFSHSGG